MWTDIKIGFIMVIDYIRENTLGINEALLAGLTFSSWVLGEEDFIVLLAAWIILGSLRVVRDVIIDSRDRVLCELKFNEECDIKDVVC